MLKIFTERLVAARAEKNQAEAADLLGISPARLSNYEIGKREPDLSFLKRIVESYGVSADWLLGVDSSPSGVSLSASGGSVAANNSTVNTGGGVGEGTERARLLAIIESQQAVIASLTGEGKGK